MSKSSSNILFLLAGAAVGATIGYIAAQNNRKELLQNVVDFAYGAYKDVTNKISEKENDIKESLEDIEDEIEDALDE